MSSPLFSIITPTFNRLELAREAIASVAAQTDTDFELIVVDDGSEQGTRQELQKLADQQGFKLLIEENGGPGLARNRGAEVATGEYLVFLDSDDVLYPWALATYREVIEQHESPALIGAKFFPVDFAAPPDVEQKELELENYPDFLACSRGESFLGACNQIVRRDVFEKVGGFVSDKINCEDHDFVLRISTEPGYVRIVQPPTLAYRVHADNLTSLSEKTVAGTLLLLQREQMGLYPGGEAREEARRRIIGKHLRPVSLTCLSTGRRSTGWMFYRRTFHWNLQDGRWRYLLGFPLKSLISWFTRSKP